MSQSFDASKSLTTLEQDNTVIAVIEMSQSKWLVAAVVPGVKRQPLKKLQADEEALLKLLYRWRTEAGQTGREIKRVVVAYEAGRDGFWLALSCFRGHSNFPYRHRWLARRFLRSRSAKRSFLLTWARLLPNPEATRGDGSGASAEGEVLKSCRRQLGVVYHVPDVAMAKIGLKRSGIVHLC